MRRGERAVVPVHLLRELPQVPAVWRGGSAEPPDVAAEVDGERDHGERDEQQRGIAPATGKEVERPAGPRSAAFVRERGHADREDEHATERVRGGPLRREAESEQ